MFLIMATFIPLGAGLMTVVASFTRSNREAQSWLSLVYIVPLAPILFAVVNGTKATPALVAIPSLGQHLIATDLMRGDPIPALNVAICAASSLLVGALLVWLAVRLYGREAILGST
jgi:sodium transport system permease protein